MKPGDVEDRWVGPHVTGEGDGTALWDGDGFTSPFTCL